VPVTLIDRNDTKVTIFGPSRARVSEPPGFSFILGSVAGLRGAARGVVTVGIGWDAECPIRLLPYVKRTKAGHWYGGWCGLFCQSFNLPDITQQTEDDPDPM